MEQEDEMDASSAGADARAGGGVRPATPGRAAMTGDPVTAGLQRLFSAIAEEPIPDDFLRLLDEIEARADQAGPAAEKRQ